MKTLTVSLPDSFDETKYDLGMLILMGPDHRVERIASEIVLQDKRLRDATLADAILMTHEALRLFEVQSLVRHIKDALQTRRIIGV